MFGGETGCRQGDLEGGRGGAEGGGGGAPPPLVSHTPPRPPRPTITETIGPTTGLHNTAGNGHTWPRGVWWVGGGGAGGERRGEGEIILFLSASETLWKYGQNLWKYGQN